MAVQRMVRALLDARRERWRRYRQLCSVVPALQVIRPIVGLSVLLIMLLMVVLVSSLLVVMLLSFVLVGTVVQRHVRLCVLDLPTLLLSFWPTTLPSPVARPVKLQPSWRLQRLWC